MTSLSKGGWVCGYCGHNSLVFSGDVIHGPKGELILDPDGVVGSAYYCRSCGRDYPLLEEWVDLLPPQGEKVPGFRSKWINEEEYDDG